MTFVIPDAIEPVVGWRCFDVSDGLLISPQQKMPWPPADKARASCSNARWHYEWVQATPEQRAELERIAGENGFTAELGHYVNYLMPGGEVTEMPVYMPWGTRGPAPPIKVYPAEGKEWVLFLRETGHEAPDKDCSCGIHLARNIALALQYRGGRNTALGVVKGWGKVIPASGGFRVEFAYPEKLFLSSPPEGPMDLSHYGVPLLPLIECGEFLDEMGLTWRS